MSATSLPPLRVLFITNAWPQPGRPSHGTPAFRDVQALRAEGVDVTVLPIHGKGHRWAYAAAAARVAARNRAGCHDLVHGYLGHAGAVARLYVRAPLVVTYTGSDLLGDHRGPGGAALRSRIEAATFRQLARVAAATITQSDQMEAVLPAGCRPRNHVIPTGVPLDLFAPASQEDARRRLGWPSEERVVLFAADPSRGVKNHPLAVESVRALQAIERGVTLRVAHGRDRDEMPVWMNAADVLLLTSRSEGSPGVVKEALATGMPVVSTPVGDVARFVTGVPGCRICPPDPQALAEGLRDALATGRSAAASAAVSGLGMRDYARRMIDVYEAVLARRS